MFVTLSKCSLKLADFQKKLLSNSDRKISILRDFLRTRVLITNVLMRLRQESSIRDVEYMKKRGSVSTKKTEKDNCAIVYDEVDARCSFSFDHAKNSSHFT